MAGFDLSSIAQTVTAPGTSGAFDCSQFKDLTVVGQVSNFTTTSFGFALYIEVLLLDGSTWVRPYPALTSGSPATVPVFTGTAAPPKTGRLAWDMPATGASLTFSVSIWGNGNDL